MQKTKTSYGYILNDLTTFIWVTPIYDLTRYLVCVKGHELLRIIPKKEKQPYEFLPKCLEKISRTYFEAFVR